MLCITRRVGEYIKLTLPDEVIWIKVNQIHGKEVRIGIEADPTTVAIDRNARPDEL